MGRGSSWALDDITAAADAFGCVNGKNEHVNSPPPPARHPSNFFFSPQFRDLTDIRQGHSERDIQEGQKLGGRREHVNIDTTTCDPIVSMSKEKIGLNMRVFPQKPIGGMGPLAQKDPIQRELGPLTVAKVQKGGFHGCQRLSKSRL